MFLLKNNNNVRFPEKNVSYYLIEATGCYTMKIHDSSSNLHQALFSRTETKNRMAWPNKHDKMAGLCKPARTKTDVAISDTNFTYTFSQILLAHQAWSGGHKSFFQPGRPPCPTPSAT